MSIARGTGLAIACVAAGVFMGDLAVTPAAAQEESSPWLVRVRGIAVVPDEGGPVAPLGGTVKIDDSFVPELDFTYFFTDNIAAELILATAEHSVAATVGPTALGEVWLLPPTLTLQYHVAPDSLVSPYLGAGVNYTIFYNTNTPAGISIDYDNSFGWVLQAGADLKLDDHWLLNVDVKKVFLDTNVSINGGAITANVDIDPWIFGVGVGYRF